jgi:hypothetical protein
MLVGDDPVRQQPAGELEVLRAVRPGAVGEQPQRSRSSAPPIFEHVGNL